MYSQNVSIYRSLKLTQFYHSKARATLKNAGESKSGQQENAPGPKSIQFLDVFKWVSDFVSERPVAK